MACSPRLISVDSRPGRHRHLGGRRRCAGRAAAVHGSELRQTARAALPRFRLRRAGRRQRWLRRRRLRTGRTDFLDYPCDLKRGEKVTFILSLHGGGLYGNWQRHYFPILDYTDKYRLVIATPFSPRCCVWTAEDDGYLQNIVTSVIEQIGRENINAFWLAGHSQGGLTSTRIVCSDFFKTKVDGFLSLSGGRVGGQAGRAANFGIPPARGATEEGCGGRRHPPDFLPARS